MRMTNSEIVDDNSVFITNEPSEGGDQTTENYNVVLVVTGRRPYRDGLGSGNLGIHMDKLGRIEVDSHFRKAVPSIYTSLETASMDPCSHTRRRRKV